MTHQNMDVGIRMNQLFAFIIVNFTVSTSCCCCYFRWCWLCYCQSKVSRIQNMRTVLVIIGLNITYNVSRTHTHTRNTLREWQNTTWCNEKWNFHLYTLKSNLIHQFIKFWVLGIVCKLKVCPVSRPNILENAQNIEFTRTREQWQ